MGKLSSFVICRIALERLINVHLLFRVKADHPFHRVQLRIMLDQTGSMLDHFAENLSDGAYDPNAAE